MGWTVRPYMHLVDRSDGPGPKPFIDLTVAFKGHSLISHLGGYFGFASCLRNDPRFPHGACQRLLAVDMLARFHRRYRDVSMVVVGRRNHHGVDALFGFQHLAIIFVAFGLWVFLENFSRIPPIDVAEGNDVLAFHFTE